MDIVYIYLIIFIFCTRHIIVILLLHIYLPVYVYIRKPCCSVDNLFKCKYELLIQAISMYNKWHDYSSKRWKNKINNSFFFFPTGLTSFIRFFSSQFERASGMDKPSLETKSAFDRAGIVREWSSSSSVTPIGWQFSIKLFSTIETSRALPPVCCHVSSSTFERAGFKNRYNKLSR